MKLSLALSSPKALRWPAEWEPRHATWLAWPANRDTWRSQRTRAETAFRHFVEALLDDGGHVEIATGRPGADAAARSRLKGLLDNPRIRLHPRLRYDDSWVRDTLPLWMHDTRRNAPLLVDWTFNSWGGKYPPWDCDDATGAWIATHRRLRRVRPGMVLEGGAVDGDGCGTVLTTEQCLLHPNRNPGRDRRGIENMLRRFLGAHRVVWLAGGIEGDDTDGHVDDVARFAAPGVVVAALETRSAEPHAAVLGENFRRLRAARDANGNRLEVVPVPMPQPLVVDGLRTPASYVNFVFGVRHVIVPVFGDSSDGLALRRIADATGRPAVPIRAEALVWGQGALHCLSQQEPAKEAFMVAGNAAVRWSCPSRQL